MLDLDARIPEDVSDGAAARLRRHTLHTAHIDRESTGPVPAPVRPLQAPADRP